MGDWFDTYMHIENGQNIRANQMQMQTMQAVQELQQRVGYLEKKYGVELPSYYEYKQENPVPEAQVDPRTVALFAAGGSLVGAAFSRSRVGGAVLGAVGGTVIGLMSGQQQERLDAEHVQHYGQYLDGIEVTLKQQAQAQGRPPHPQTVAHNPIPQGMVVNPVIINGQAL